MDYARAYGYLRGSVETLADQMEAAGLTEWAEKLRSALRESEQWDLDEFRVALKK